jgi:acetyltransferase-like isoleucine patch superfamily enzyme
MKIIIKCRRKTTLIKKIIKGIKGGWYFAWGNLFSFFIYDRKFIQGKYFTGKMHGICAIGWQWVVTDCMARILLGINRGIPFPVSPRINIVNPQNIIFNTEDLNNFQGVGNYYQALGNSKIVIGKGSWIAPNVGLITTNHDINNPDMHVESKNIILGEKCWIGMNSVILPGVTLGPNTTVGAGSVVTKSFPEGKCVIAGNPARKIKNIE